MMIQLTPIVSRAKSKWYEPKKVKKLALNSQLLTDQILTINVQCTFCVFLILLLCTVNLKKDQFKRTFFVNDALILKTLCFLK